MKSINLGDMRELPEPQFMVWITSDDPLTLGGKTVKRYQIAWDTDDEILDDWALHIRRHYLRDDELARRCAGRQASPAEYLKKNVIPQREDQNGPQIIAGDFAEILVMDIARFLMDYVVPRYKHHNRKIKTASEQGSDVLAYKFVGSPSVPSSDDQMQVVEVKSAVSERKASGVEDRIASAATGSARDRSRYSMTLEYMIDEAIDAKDDMTRDELLRFQDKGEHPFDERFGIAVTMDSKVAFEDGLSLEDSAADDINGLVIIVRAEEFKKLVYDIYSRCTS